MTLLTTDRLTLSPVAPADFDDLCALFGDMEFTRHIMGRALNEEEVWSRLLRDLGHWQVLGYGNWTIRSRADGTYVGQVGVLDYRRHIDPPLDAPELGWGLATAHQGHGYALEALSAVLGWADAQLTAARTVCMIAPDNAPSQTLAARAGYRAYAQTDYAGGPVILLERPRRKPPTVAGH
ncbi:GNAT family N-acetyltransferase [Brevundimonas sp.]|uniref:GNAT family N-acetyltransferase n=1 Tax=Brevundimonas sp. TaxID=1871086 RepID=UPI002ABB66BD|nr:GNAT family N-acetyltransferase [Brevundimonas sp.]MDZ4364294.1 GNAT family N-acetyltransferase [Brevundimonas sp.]